MGSWNSYPSIYNLGHRALKDLFNDPVLIEEKIDGSQFSFGVFEMADGTRELKCRSKGAQLNLLAPEGMFLKAIATARTLQPILIPGWTYRAEYLAKPKHNTLAYNRTPRNYLIIFDIACGEEDYLNRAEKIAECERIGLECVPLVFEGKVNNLDVFRSYLDAESCLGGQKIEGVVVKAYDKFGPDKKPLLGKFVSEEFKEIHGGEWRKANPTNRDFLDSLILELSTPARWHKAVQHLRELGRLEGSPKDIGLLIKEIPSDIFKECEEDLKERIWEHARSKIARGVTKGFPEWYKEQLLKKQFEAA